VEASHVSVPPGFKHPWPNFLPVDLWQPKVKNFPRFTQLAVAAQTLLMSADQTPQFVHIAHMHDWTVHLSERGTHPRCGKFGGQFAVQAFWGDLGEIRPRLLLALSGSCSTGLERRPSDAKAEEKSPHPTRIGAIVQPSRLCQPVSIAVRRTILREAYEFIVPQDFWKIVVH